MGWDCQITPHTGLLSRMAPEYPESMGVAYFLQVEKLMSGETSLEMSPPGNVDSQALLLFFCIEESLSSLTEALLAGGDALLGPKFLSCTGIEGWGFLEWESKDIYAPFLVGMGVLRRVAAVRHTEKGRDLQK